MEKTVEKDGITIKLDVNRDGTVNLKKMMEVSYEHNGELVKNSMYPDCVAKGKYGTIQGQFDLVKATMRFYEVYEKSKNELAEKKGLK